MTKYYEWVASGLETGYLDCDGDSPGRWVDFGVLFEDTILCAMHNRTVTIMAQDIQLARYIRDCGGDDKDEEEVEKEE